MNALSYHHTSLLQAYPFHYYTVDPSLRVPGTAYVMESPKESSRIAMVFAWYIPTIICIYIYIPYKYSDDGMGVWIRLWGTHGYPKLGPTEPDLY